MNDSLREVLEQNVLPLVEKPGRYIGGELNIVRKPPDAELLRIALCFPDAYEIGMSHSGFGILYHLVNRDPRFAAERAYAPMPDMEEHLRRQGLPLYTLENYLPLCEMDVVGFTLQYELTYTNILTMLELGSVPLPAAERREDDPLVIAGGPCAGNPEPLAEFLDAVVLGDGEETLMELMETLHRHRDKSRGEKLWELSRVSGVYVPSFYRSTESDGTRFGRVTPKRPDVPARIQFRRVPSLSEEHYPHAPLVPLVEIVHDRLGIEIMRGCTRGCRFCSAGTYYRPRRGREPEGIVRSVGQQIAGTGWSEAFFLSLSSTDYPELISLLSLCDQQFRAKRVNLSLPSIRSDTIAMQLLDRVSLMRKSSLTLAPEAGSQRLRCVINKNLTEEEILNSVRLPLEKGWQSLKLYFMMGLPSETDEDAQAIVSLGRACLQAARRILRNAGIKISVSAFSPKPHTPFQWSVFGPRETLIARGRNIRQGLRRKGIEASYSNVDVACLETVFARGDRKLSKVLLEAWKRGARFDGWSEHFDFENWKTAFSAAGVDMSTYTHGIDLEEPLPWDHLEVVKRPFLIEEYHKSLRGELSLDCSNENTCMGCGASSPENCFKHKAVPGSGALKQGLPDPPQFGRRSRRQIVPSQGLGVLHRLQYAKRAKVRFLGHLDLVRLWERAFRRSGLELAFSQGFHPHAKISFGPPVSVGEESDAEFIDVHFANPIAAGIASRLNPHLPDGVEVMGDILLLPKAKSLSADICAADYVSLIPSKGFLAPLESVEQVLASEEIHMRRRGKSGEKKIDIRKHILELRPENGSQPQNPHPVPLHMKLSAGQQGHGRPREVLQALLQGWPEDEITKIRVRRTAQWVRRGDEWVTPMHG